MKALKVIQGSVKDIAIIKEPTERKTGKAIFNFTDHYSVFDFGRMPDLIPGKGESICRMASYNFKQLKKLKIKSHFIKMISPNKMSVKLYRVIDPREKNLSNECNYLVPLEIIFRNMLPEGSSVFKRLEKKEITIKDLGLKKEPKANEMLEKPLLDVSTKLEDKDRYLSWLEAQKISGLTSKQIEELKNIALKINDFLNEKAESIGLVHADGKIELALNEKKELVVVDVFGTLDENRFLFNGIQLNKQILRDYYKEFTSWPKEFELKGFKAKPPKLPKELIKIVSNAYKSVCETWINKKIWNAPKVDLVAEEYLNFLEKIRNENRKN